MRWGPVSKLRFDAQPAGAERSWSPTISLACPKRVTCDVVSQEQWDLCFVLRAA